MIRIIIYGLLFISIIYCCKEEIKTNTFERTIDAGEGLKFYEQNKKWGIKNRQNDKITQAVYDTIQTFLNNNAIVSKHNKYGLIDTSGKILIPISFDAISNIEEGYLIVGKKEKADYSNFIFNWKFAIMKENGELFTDFIYDTPRFFREGLLAHKVIKENEKWRNYLNNKFGDDGKQFYKPDEKWGYIDREGKTKIPHLYGKMKLGTGYMTYTFMTTKDTENVNGRLNSVIVSGDGDEFPVGDFNQGKARVLNGKWGFINKQNECIIKFKYDDIGIYKNGIAKIKVNEKWGFINEKGEEFIKPKYEEVQEYSEGFAAVKEKGQWGYINLKGNKITPFKYDKAYEFYHGYGMVEFGGETRYIDKEGNEKISL